VAVVSILWVGNLLLRKKMAHSMPSNGSVDLLRIVMVGDLNESVLASI